MKERPIIFNADMVRAVLEGRKTQTRRIMRVQPESNQFGLRRIIASAKRSDTGKYHWTESNATGNHIRSAPFSCPFGAIGDRLWVRESFYEHGHWQGGGYDPEDSYFVSDKQVLYPADGIKRPAERKREDFWRSSPSIHMPRWASRITLEITGVRVERLRDLSEQDAKSEGVMPPAGGVLPGWEHRINFRDLWMSIYGADNWEANPWVWVIEFKRVEVE
ncbi:hypothetical protein [Pantoea agglomerans]|uniref:hypothetical protein n=1 Tax=Enterobacter agglomerans TaxID=549 RepID=UPI003208ABFA